MKFREGTPADYTSGEKENCELSDRDTRDFDLENPQYFETGIFDYYERTLSRQNGDADCLDGNFFCNKMFVQDMTMFLLLQLDKFVTKMEWNLL